MESSYLRSRLYLNKVSLTGTIPAGNYLNGLPVIRNLYEMDGI